MKLSFVLSEVDDEGTNTLVSGSGSAVVVAQLMRSAADEIDPPKKDPAYEMGRNWGENLMSEFLGNLGKPQK